MYLRYFLGLLALVTTATPVFAAKAKSRPLSQPQKLCQRLPVGSLGGWKLSDLEWVSDKSLTCGGYFKSQQMTFTPNFVLDNADYVSITPAGLKAKGHIKARKGYQHFSADSIQLKQKNKKVQEVHLVGNVSVREKEQFLKAKRADYFPETGYGEIADVLYVLKYQSNSAWGQACRVRRLGPGKLDFQRVSYSTCSPTHVAWQIKARDIQLDKKTSTGVAHGATLYVGDFPTVYLPYLSFPLDNKRKSGFLMPKVTYNTQNGTMLQVPYYLNLAPNYDATLVPRYYSKRGFMWGGEFRYLAGPTLSLIHI